MSDRFLLLGLALLIVAGASVNLTIGCAVAGAAALLLAWMTRDGSVGA